jgi:hypothetical protein
VGRQLAGESFVTHKIYCYVDESGQDTHGDLFVVAVVVVAEDKDDLTQVLEMIERETGKGRVKWHKTLYARRLAYMQRILAEPELPGKCNIVLRFNSRDYFHITVETIAAALKAQPIDDYKAIVLIDALPASQATRIGNLLRQAGVPVKKVRGIQDEADAMIRLADALCGFVRAAYEEQPEMLILFERAIRQGLIKDLSQR